MSNMPAVPDRRTNRRDLSGSQISRQETLDAIHVWMRGGHLTPMQSDIVSALMTLNAEKLAFDAYRMEWTR